MNENKFVQRIASLRDRLHILSQQVHESPRPQPDLITQIFQELQTNIEELQVAQEELCQQNEALATTREVVEAERQHYQELFNFAPDGYLVTDAHGKIRQANCVAAELLNVDQVFLLDIPLAVFVPLESRQVFQTRLAQLHQIYGVQEWEVRLKPKHGLSFDAALRVGVVRNHEDQLISVHWLLRDISDRQQAEEQIKTSLREKELLLKEIHHRVKNNLQIIVSLLRLQSRRSLDQKVQEILEDSQNRVNAMALVHESLYQSQDLARINFAEYIQKLAAHLFFAHHVQPNTVTLKVHVNADVSVGLAQAIPCGLIVNELMTNALKHGCQGHREGEVFVALEASPDTRLTLSVGNHGNYLPTGFNLQTTQSMGLRLVMALVEQLKGTLELDISENTVFKITFTAYV